MARIYGGRWAIIDGPKLGSGGQGEVFRVRDVTGQAEGEFALKRVPDVNRRERFKREVEAIKRLTDPETQAAHPNIISLIDYSALDDTEDGDRQFLVMPIANGGDLSALGRLALYKDSIDAGLQVATQVAGALDAAHKVHIVHRDVKPKNVLFTGNGHETWLTDFGICLIREAPRLTDPPEVMGPRAFMAPELEYGGRLDVTPAADIYSLGKLIYFMLSGGITIPREELHMPEFAALFRKGQRYSLLEMLLRRMVCPLDRRIATTAEVLSELKTIEDWEKNAQLLPMSADALAAVQNLQQRSMESARIAEENRQARQQETNAQAAVQTSLTAWLTAELEKVAATVRSDNIKCMVQDAGVPANIGIQTGHASMYRALNGVELIVDDANDRQNGLHRLQFFLCCHSRVLIVSGRGAQAPAAEPARDIELAVVPLYRQGLKHANPGIAPSLGYISRSDQIGQTRGRIQMPGPSRRPGVARVAHYRVARIAHTFEGDVAVHIAFRASEWPSNEAAVRIMLGQALEGFFAQLNA